MKFHRPLLPHADTDVKAASSLDWAVLQYRKEILPNSLIVGIGLGGLIATRLQELSPHLDLSVVALAAPTSEDDVAVSMQHPFFPALAICCQQTNLVSMYSSADDETKGRDNWKDFTPWSFDMPMLQYHDINLCKYAVCYLISRYIQGRNMAEEVPNLFPLEPPLI
jgi:hypothetical protein